MPQISPFVVSGTIELSGAAVSTAAVIIRNERTNESASVNTNSSGKFLKDLRELDSGWTVGDIITAACIYQNYEVSSSYTILASDGGHEFGTLALIAVSVGDLNYCTIQDVYDFLFIDSSSTDITAEQIRKIGLRVEDMIERRCNSIFHDNNGDYTTITTEHHDVRNKYQRYFFVRKRPIISMTTAEANVADESATANWITVTTEVKTDLDTGRVDIVGITANGPNVGTRMMRFTYTYGFASVPEEIKELTILMIVRELVRSTIGRSLIEGRDNFRPTELTAMDEQIENIFKRHTYHNLTNI